MSFGETMLYAGMFHGINSFFVCLLFAVGSNCLLVHLLLCCLLDLLIKLLVVVNALVNQYICLFLLGANDIGGTITIHVFGVCFHSFDPLFRLLLDFIL
jgi:hypothetical protein